MGTKNNPGKFDCMSKAEPDEPVFVLLGRDPVAAIVVRLWTELRAKLGDKDSEKIQEAWDCADAMEAWARKKEKEVDRANDIWLHEWVVPAKTPRPRAVVKQLLKELQNDPEIARRLGALLRDEEDRFSERASELEALCRRAADAVELLCSITTEVQSPADGEGLAHLIEELRAV